MSVIRGGNVGCRALGVEINEKEAAKHPFKPEVIHTQGAVLGDGTVVDW
ncbi:hypothetical protein [Chelativorans sp. AA-79]|nr:hypothetical protein [Chelativorans sp. AA-79]WEX10774.1 hypothetical protein PVE73_07515 [Chelativorans sp. AA-79]